MFKQKDRRACLAAIQSVYGVVAELLADRKGHNTYWSIWSFAPGHLYEVIRHGAEIAIYEYQTVEKQNQKNIENCA